MSFCQNVILSKCQYVILSKCYFVKMSKCHFIKMSKCLLSKCQNVICQNVILSKCQNYILPLSWRHFAHIKSPPRLNLQKHTKHVWDSRLLLPKTAGLINTFVFNKKTIDINRAICTEGSQNINLYRGGFRSVLLFNGWKNALAQALQKMLLHFIAAITNDGFDDGGSTLQ